MVRRLVLAATLVILVVSGVAQTVTGTLECRVTDPSGAVIAGADVSVRNEETGVQYWSKPCR
jgi:hypothetical protein